MSSEFVSTCLAGHRARHRGLFAAWRFGRWWRKHDRCVEVESMGDMPDFVIVRRSSCIFEVHRLLSADANCYTRLATCDTLTEARQVADALRGGDRP